MMVTATPESTHTDANNGKKACRISEEKDT